jgi:parvulin-like peptidyl-prolyl isomerase
MTFKQFALIFLLSSAALSLGAEEPKKPKTKEETIAAIPVEPLEDGVVLQSGEVKIPVKLVGECEKAYSFYLSKTKGANFEQTPKERMEFRKQFAFNLLSQMVIENYVETNKLSASKEAVDREIENIKAGKKKQGTTFDRFLEMNGFTEEGFRKFVEANCAFQENMAKSVSNEQVEKEFQERMPLRRASDILFMYKGSSGAIPAITRSKDEAKAAAADALAKIKEKPDTFVQCVKEMSDNNRSREKDGDLGWIAHKSGMIETLSEALYKLEKPGDLTDVLETPFGFHIIKMTQLRTIDDMKKEADPEKFNQAKSEIKAIMTSEKVGAEMQKLIEQAVAKAKFNEKEVKVP